MGSVASLIYIRSFVVRSQNLAGRGGSRFRSSGNVEGFSDAAVSLEIPRRRRLTRDSRNRRLARDSRIPDFFRKKYGKIRKIVFLRFRTNLWRVYAKEKKTE